MNSKRLIYLALTVVTLSIGVLIGSIVSGGVKAIGEQKPPVLAIPDPVLASNSFAGIASQLEPAVVNIQVLIAPPKREVTQAPRPGGRGGGGRGRGNGGNGGNGQQQIPIDPNSIDPNSLGDALGRLFGPQEDPEPAEATGTGFIVDKSGYILTNEHVVEKASKITVRLSDKTELPAKLIGTDNYTDLAVIKVDAGKDLQVARFGNSDAVRTGDWVLAIGSPFGFDHTVTSGIISAKGRSADDLNGTGAPRTKGQGFQSFLQTDAAINPGNSGGPLVNLSGEVIGINTAIVSETNSFAGLGFALPSNIAIKVYNQIAQNGKVVRGSIGISYVPDDPETLRAFGVKDGVVIASVIPGKPAAQAGLRQDDVITQIEGQKIVSGAMLLDIIASSPIDHPVQVKVMRDGKEQTIPVMIADRARIIDGESAPTESASPSAPALPTDRVLGISVQAIPQNYVKKYSLSGVAIKSILKDSVGADAFRGPIAENSSTPPFVIDSIVVDGHVNEIRQPADYDHVISGLKRGTRIAFGVMVPLVSLASRDYAYERKYFAAMIP